MPSATETGNGSPEIRRRFSSPKAGDTGRSQTRCHPHLPGNRQLVTGAAMAEARKTAKAELAARIRKWNAADEQFGYSRTRSGETQIAGIQEASANSLWEAPALTTSDIIAKLHAIIETEDPGSQLMERPWPQLQIILADLVRIDHPA
ncbi:hypothetical protein [Rhizobium sp. Leaf391]|uniref:hypothetical protein n=1 Tax=Rhizobium sp. Leaf391 TaxID=1736360 RepID=UPI0012E37091|nr:hypothetical protein [Rhizobium sp. Leaf391]